MKKFLLYILISFASLSAAAQAKVQTKQYVLADFGDKTMKVVMTGNEMIDAAIRLNMEEIWHISPYEFCEQDEFESIKKSDSYYFLTLTDVAPEGGKKSGVRFFSVFKGKSTATDSVNGLYKVASIPFSASGLTDGREVALIGPMITALQENIHKMTISAINFRNIAAPNAEAGKTRWRRQVLIDSEDIQFQMDSTQEEAYRQAGIICADTDEVEAAIIKRDAKSAVCYVVYPEEGTKNGTCYVMVFDAGNYDLLYIKAHGINKNYEGGIMASDLKAISSRN